MDAQIYHKSGSQIHISYGVRVSGSGLVADYWGVDFSALPTVIGHVSLPIYGGSISDLSRDRAVDRLPVVFDLFSGWTFSEGLILDEAPEDHIAAHLHAMRVEHLWNDNSTMYQTAGLYSMLSDFRVRNPAVVIQKHMGVSSVRTVHDRIARARQAGMIPSFGQGRAHL